MQPNNTLTPPSTPPVGDPSTPQNLGVNDGSQPTNGAPTPPTQHIANPEPEQQKPNSPSNGSWKEHLGSIFSFAMFIGGVILAAFLINQFVFQSYFVEGTSMVPTLQDGDRLIIEKVGKTVSQVQGKPYIPNRGDIVVLDSTLIRADGAQEQLIKRVIGLPGETIHIENGVVTVANTDEPGGFNVNQRLGLELEPTYSSDPQDFSVPAGHVFVMGDNRTQNGSHDSRAFGAVDPKDLEGHLWARILPVDQAKVFGLIPNEQLLKQ
jgi:signal peptidase I